MAQEIENNNKKKLFSRWKENLRDFFIEDEKLNDNKICEKLETSIDEYLKTEDTEKEDEVIEKAEEQIIENNCTSTTNGNGELEEILEDGEESCAQEENNVEQVGEENIDTVDTSVSGDKDSEEKTVGERANENVQTKLNILERIGSFSFLRKSAKRNHNGCHQVVRI